MAVELRRELGFWDTVAVIVGSVIGVGIFFTPASVARAAGSEPAALALWVLGGLSAAAGGVTMATLGRRYARTGGQYEVLRDAWGHLAGFLFVWCSFTAIQAGAIAIIACLFTENVFRAMGVVPSPAAVQVGALVATVGLAGANVLGVRAGAGIQNFTVWSKLLTLGAVIAVGSASSQPVGEVAPIPATIATGILPAMFAYGGFQQALWVGGEVRDGERTLPRATLLGVGIVIVVYLAAAWAWFRILGFEGVQATRALAFDAGAAVGGPAAGRVVAGAVAISAFGVLNAQFLTAPRLAWALARDGRFFTSLASVHPRFGSPWVAILALAGVSVVLLLVAGKEGLGSLLAWQVVVNALFFALTGAALLRMDIGGKVAGAAFVLFELGAVAGALFDPNVRAAALVGLGWVAAAVVLYQAAFRRAGPGQTRSSTTSDG